MERIAMVTVRAMQGADADAVRELDAQAFAPYARRQGSDRPMPLRRQENVLACRALNPQGCFVAQAAGAGLVGYLFSRRWGALGWIGVFGVHPDWHGQGIGRKLLAHAVAQLEAGGCQVVGLETMPDSTYNVGLYTRAGFRPLYSTVTLERPATRPTTTPPVALLAGVDRGAGLVEVARISGSAQPGFDYTVEARNALEFAWGETLLIGWPQPWAVAIVRTAAKRENQENTEAGVDALAAEAGARGRLSELLQALDAFAVERGLEHVRIPVNAADWPTLRALEGQGFQIAHLALRLLRKGEYGCPLGIELSRWAM